MKIKILYCIVLFTFGLNVNAQFNTSKYCEININDNLYNFNNFLPQIRSVFRIDYSGYAGGICTGALINQGTDRSNMRQLFITAKHCDLDISKSLQLVFNFQSPDFLTDHVPNGIPFKNRGEGDWNFRYVHNSKVILIGQGVDYALYEIINPIPPHFNVYYSGWNATLLPSPPYVGIHHPKGDIKKGAIANGALLHIDGLDVACTNITDIIDVVCGWFGGSCNTQSACSYVTFPWITLFWDAGTTEHGSSGSPLFDSNGRIIGMDSGGFAGCVSGIEESYGKMSTALVDPSIRPALDPGNTHTKILGGRDANCFGDISLSGNYFAAKDYQQKNKIYITSTSNISTKAYDKNNDGKITNNPNLDGYYDNTEGLLIFNSADFSFIAQQSITLNDGFEVQAGANFEAKIGPCSDGSNYRINSVGEKNLKKQDLAPKEEISPVFSFNAFPNPASGIVSFKFNLPFKSNLKIVLTDLFGKTIDVVIDEKGHEPGEFTAGLDITNLNSGVYLYTIQTNNYKETKRLVISK